VRLVLDSGGVTGLVGQRARLEELRRRQVWPPILPSVVLTECLTGDHRRDFHTNRLLRTCEVREVDELLARRAASLRGSVGTSRVPSAVDAVVVALAEGLGGATVLTSDPRDLRALAGSTSHPVRIAVTTPR
jgi:hypothetical protein